MATKLGEIQVSTIEGDTLTGTFTSVYERNVFDASIMWGAGVLEEAWEEVGEPDDSGIGALQRSISLDPLARRIAAKLVEVTFDTPNSESTTFRIKTSDPTLFDGLKSIWWESYLFG